MSPATLVRAEGDSDFSTFCIWGCGALGTHAHMAWECENRPAHARHWKRPRRTVTARLGWGNDSVLRWLCEVAEETWAQRYGANSNLEKGRAREARQGVHRPTADEAEWNRVLDTMATDWHRPWWVLAEGESMAEPGTTLDEEWLAANVANAADAEDGETTADSMAESSSEHDAEDEEMPPAGDSGRRWA